MNAAMLERWMPTMLSILRIVVGLLFFEHGCQKLLGFPAGANPMPAMLSYFWWSGAVELVCGALVAIGLFTRLAAFFAAGEMAIAYWSVHVLGGMFPVNNGGDAAILYCFVFLFLVFAGAGPLSIDSVRARRAPSP